MRDLLRGSLARSLRMLPDEDRLAAALPVVCGPALGAHCRVDRLDQRGTLHLRVDGTPWLRSLVSMRDTLQRDLARTAGVAIERLEFAAPQRRPGTGTVWAGVEAPRDSAPGVVAFGKSVKRSGSDE